MSGKRRRRKGKLIGVGSALPGVLSELGLDEARRVFEIGERWEEAVGPELARRAKPLAMRGEVLEVGVESSVWAQQLQRRRPEILAALERVFAASAPTDLRFRVGYTARR